MLWQRCEVRNGRALQRLLASDNPAADGACVAAPSVPRVMLPRFSARFVSGVPLRRGAVGCFRTDR